LITNKPTAEAAAASEVEKHTPITKVGHGGCFHQFCLPFEFPLFFSPLLLLLLLLWLMLT